MLGSASRILSTHAGSLPRPPELVALQVRVSRGQPADEETLAGAAQEATRRAIARQLDIGIDVGNDGEQPRESFFTYVRYRMSGFAGESARPALRDLDLFPGVRAQVQARSLRRLVRLGRNSPRLVRLRRGSRRWRRDILPDISTVRGRPRRDLGGSPSR